MTRRQIHAADLFCGAGGTSAGLLDACEELNQTLHLTAINHWQVAVQTHRKNLPIAQRNYPLRKPTPFQQAKGASD